MTHFGLPRVKALGENTIPGLLSRSSPKYEGESENKVPYFIPTK
jgi:hypothetical protein